MTTIIIVVVVALVFFVALCTGTFMVWKREEEMRTDSLKSIESNLQELGYRLSDESGMEHVGLNAPVTGGANHNMRRGGLIRNADPFEWVRDTEESEPVIPDDEYMPEYSDEYDYDDGFVTDDISSNQEPMDIVDTHSGRRDYAGGEQRDDVSAVRTDTDNRSGEESFATELGTRFESEEHSMTECTCTENIETAKVVQPERETPQADEHSVDEDQGIDLTDLIGNSIDILNEDDIIDDDDFTMLDDINDIDEYVLDYETGGMTETGDAVRYDVGQSGKKYTAEELDMLIKE